MKNNALKEEIDTLNREYGITIIENKKLKNNIDELNIASIKKIED
jgi:hypothetical protein